MQDDHLSLLLGFLSGGGLVSLINALHSIRQDRIKEELDKLESKYSFLLIGSRVLYDQVISLNGVPNYLPPEDEGC